jgi:hypothetical protein
MCYWLNDQVKGQNLEKEIFSCIRGQKNLKITTKDAIMISHDKQLFLLAALHCGYCTFHMNHPKHYRTVMLFTLCMAHTYHAMPCSTAESGSDIP